jgi:hypothetical protein
METLERHRKALALPEQNMLAVNEATPLLNVTKAQMRGMTAEDCEEAALLLQQWSFHLQRRANLLQATVEWCEEAIRHVIAEDVSKMPGWSFDERRAVAVRRSEAASRFQALKVQAQVMAADIAYCPVRVENQARRFADLARTKVKQHG